VEYDESSRRGGAGARDKLADEIWRNMDPGKALAGEDGQANHGNQQPAGSASVPNR